MKGHTVRPHEENVFGNIRIKRAADKTFIILEEVLSVFAGIHL